MGVANTTPICNNANNHLTRENENVIANYTLTLSKNNESVNTYNNKASGSLVQSTTGFDKETIINYSGNNQAINVFATSYITEMKFDDTSVQTDQHKMFIENYNYYIVNEEYYEHATSILNIFQIDSYNYNVNTETTTTITCDIRDYDYSNAEYYIWQRYYAKLVYRTTESDFANYIHRQHTNFQAHTIYSEIENPNSNFYYTKESSIIQTTGQNTTDETTISLIPNARNYLVIVYIPLVKASAMDGNGNGIPEFSSSHITIPFAYTNGLSQTTYTFTGTNIIPESNYEVIDLPGLMWHILTMPFSFVSQAFNLTLFPGTPYQINISNLFLSIIAIFVFVGLISMFIKFKG